MNQQRNGVTFTHLYTSLHFLRQLRRAGDGDLDGDLERDQDLDLDLLHLVPERVHL